MSANAHPTLKPVPAALGRHYGWTALALMPGIAFAGPTGEQVQQGTVAVTRPDANTTTVTQTSNGAVVNWHSFSVGGQEYVQFVQPGANAAILNRVTGGNASEILGRIDGNGRVFLVNPQGVYFGAGARVDTSGFAASTLDIDDADFMQGRYVFAKGSGAPDANVTNSGQITADQFVVLMGDRVANEGLVQARLGTVALAAGEKVSLQLDATGLISFAVDEATAAAHAGVENTGEIIANGGRVLMTAKVANDLVATAVNNAGLVRAVGVDEDGGSIFLRGSGGKVVNSGTLDAGGVNGGRVLVTSATDDVEITAGAVVSATGQGEGAGGMVRLVAERSLDVAAGARVVAHGGANGGEGGVIEVSAHEGDLLLAGDVQAGPGGQVVVDPARLAITAGAGAPGGDSTSATVSKGFIEGQLNANTDVVLVAGNEIFASGGPFTITATGSGDLALRIGNVVSSFSGSLSGSGGSYGGDCGSLGVCNDVGVPNGFFNFTQDTAGDINLAGIGINIKGVFQASAGSATGNVSLGNVQARDILINDINNGIATGNVTLGALQARNDILVRAGGTTGNLNVGAINMSAASGNVDLALLAAAGNLNVAGPISLLASGASNPDADISIDGRVVNINGNVTAVTQGVSGSASIDIAAQNGIVVNGNVVANAANGFEASIDIQNSASGNINIVGNVSVSGSSAFSSIENRNGDIAISGNLNAVGSSAGVRVRADGGKLTLVGNTTVQASYGGSASFFATRGLVVQGNVDVAGSDFAGVFLANAEYGSGSGNLVAPGNLRAAATNGPAIVSIVNPAGAVALGGVVAAEGAGNQFSTTQIFVRGGAGGVTTFNNGLLRSERVTVGTRNNGPINVRTSAPNINLFNSGAASPDAAVDNTAFTGVTVLSMNSSFGSYGSSSGFAIGQGDTLLRGGGSIFSSVANGFGALKLAFVGDTTISGNFAARNALIDVSNGTLNIKGFVLIGERNLPNNLGDPLSLLALSRGVRPDGSRIPLPRFNGVVTSGPNAVFRARNGIEFADGLAFDDPDTPYVIFQTDGKLTLGPGVFSEGSIGNEFLAQFAAYTPTATIHVENAMPLVPFTNGPTFTNLDHFSKLPGTTMILGGLLLPSGPQTGSIVIGLNGKIDIGAQNILFSSRGAIRGAANVLSTGFVGEVGSLQNVLAQKFQTPIVNEFNENADDEDKDEEFVAIDGDADTGDDELVAQKSNNGQMCE